MGSLTDIVHKFNFLLKIGKYITHNAALRHFLKRAKIELYQMAFGSIRRPGLYRVYRLLWLVQNLNIINLYEHFTQVNRSTGLT